MRLRSAALAALFALAGCGGADVSARVRTTTAGVEDAPEVRASLARLRRARAARESHGVMPSAQLRVQRMTGTSLETGDGLDLEVRLSPSAPWSVVQAAEADDARIQSALHDLAASSLAARAARCLEGARRASATEQARLAADLDAPLSAVMSWSQEWAEAGSVDVFEATRTRLELLQLRADLERAAPEPRADVELPALPSAERGLRRDFDSVRAQIAEAHPRPAAQLALALRYARLAEAERLRVIPWLDWVRVEYPSGTDAVDGLGVSVAVRVPLDDRAGADVGSLDAQADEARAQADVAIDELSRRALAALEILSTFEAQSASLRELEEAAQSALRDVSEWISTRSGTPRAVAAILSEAYRSRVTIARARAEAAQAACDLWMASGVDPAAWPREAR